MANLSEEQKKKMLEEQAIMAELHKQPIKDDHAILKNLTVEEKEEYIKKLEKEAAVAYENAIKEMEERERKMAE